MTTQFDTLISLAQTRTDDAARELALRMNQARDAEYKCVALATYRDEYRIRLEEMTRNGAAALTLNNFRAFVAKLDEAVQIQQGEAARRQHAVAEARGLWQREQRQLRSYTTVQARRDDARRRHDSKIEQKQQDEQSARGFFFGAPRAAFAH